MHEYTAINGAPLFFTEIKRVDFVAPLAILFSFVRAYAVHVGNNSAIVDENRFFFLLLIFHIFTLILGIEMTCNHMPVAVVLEFRCNFFADVHAMIATGMEFATLGRIDGTGNVAAENYAVAVPVRVGNGHSREQRLRVGMHGIIENIHGRRILNKTAEVHNSDLIGDVFDNRKVVRNEYIGEPHLLLHVFEKIDNLRLD